MSVLNIPKERRVVPVTVPIPRRFVPAAYAGEFMDAVGVLDTQTRRFYPFSCRLSSVERLCAEWEENPARASDFNFFTDEERVSVIE